MKVKPSNKEAGSCERQGSMMFTACIHPHTKIKNDVCSKIRSEALKNKELNSS